MRHLDAIDVQQVPSMTFPVGYHSLHPDASMNFQMNRWSVGWGIGQGMRVTGTRSTFEFLRITERFQTSDVSALVSQDVLLLAGSEDHYVPMTQWHEQMRMLGNARSITARLFTRSECAQNHCQVGNYGSALRTIVSWLEETQFGDAGPTPNRLAGVA